MKRTLTSIAAAALVLGAMTPAAFAASTANTAAKVVGTKAVVVDGTTLSNPYELTAVDSGNTTAYFGIYYFNQALTKAGFQASWDGTNHIWNITAPGVDASTIKFDSTGQLGAGNTTIKVNGVVVKYINTFSHKDPAGGSSDTTYFPVYYVNNLLSALGAGGSWNATSGLTVTSPVKAFAVAGVKALNAYQLEVDFTQPVDTTTAQTAGNYALASSTGSLSLASTGGAVVGADGQSVVLTLASPITTSTNVSVTVKNVQLANVSTTVVPLYTTVVNVNDTTAADVSSVSSVTNGDTAGSVTINFTEPVASGYVKIDGTSIGSVGAVGGESSHTFTGLSLDPTVSHTLTVVNLTDGAGNVSQVSKTFSVTVDKVSPSVASVAPYGDHQILVTFSKKMDTTANDAGNPATAGNIVAKDESLNNISGISTAALTGDTTGTKFVVTLPTTLYSSNQTSRNITLLFANTNEDYLGNTVAQTLKTVTLTKDTTAPTVTGLSYVKDPSTGNVTDILVDFSEPVATGSTPAGSDVTVIDGNGVLKSGFLATGSNSATNPNEIDFPLATAAALTGTYSFNVAAGTVTDQASTPNNNKAYNGTINFGSGTPAATTWSLTGTPATNTTGDVITVNFGQAVKGGAVTGSATDPSNYSINGTVLPQGTLITLNSTQTVATITVPAGTIATSDNNASFRIAGIQNANGATLNPFIQLLSVTDNTAPTLKSAHVVDTNHVILTFSEAMASLGTSGTALASGEVTLTDYAGNPITGTFTASNVSGYSNEVEITISGTGAGLTTTQLAHPVSVAIGTTTNLKDVAGNAATSATVASN